MNIKNNKHKRVLVKTPANIIRKMLGSKLYKKRRDEK